MNKRNIQLIGHRRKIFCSLLVYGKGCGGVIFCLINEIVRSGVDYGVRLVLFDRFFYGGEGANIKLFSRIWNDGMLFLPRV